MTQVTPAERHPHRWVSHLPAHLHIATTFCGNRLIHFDGNSVPKCSSHSCSTGSNLASRSLSVASSRHALLTRNAPRRICPRISLLLGGRASIPALELLYCSTLNWLNVWAVVVDLSPAQTRIKYFSASTTSWSVSPILLPDVSQKKQRVGWLTAAPSDVSHVVYRGDSIGSNKSLVTSVGHVPSTSAVSLCDGRRAGMSRNDPHSASLSKTIAANYGSKSTRRPHISSWSADDVFAFVLSTPHASIYAKVSCHQARSVDICFNNLIVWITCADAVGSACRILAVI